MSDHDLEIDNYDLEDLLGLLKLNYNFDESDLKAAWKRCLKTHPDKSGLEPKYFIFYKKAFKVISEIFHFRSRRKDMNTEYIVEENESERKLLDPIQKNKEKFNKWFNEMFDKIRVADNEQDNGYEEWFRSGSESVEKERIPLSQFEKEFYKRKKESGMLVKHRGIMEFIALIFYAAAAIDFVTGWLGYNFTYFLGEASRFSPIILVLWFLFSINFSSIIFLNSSLLFFNNS